MPITNSRNDQQASILSGDFSRRNGHIEAYSRLPDALSTMFGARHVLWFSRHVKNTAAYAVQRDEMDPTLNWAFTASTGTLASIASPGVIYSKNGWGGVVRLGTVSNRCLYYSPDHPNYDFLIAEGEVSPSQRGFSGFAGIIIPPSWVDPTGTNGSVVFAKWDFTRIASQRSFMFDYYGNSGAPNWRFALSTDGGNTNIQTWMSGDTSQRIVASSSDWQSVFCGFSVVPGSGGGVYFYKNNTFNWQNTPLFDGVGTGYPNNIFNGAAYPTIARREDSTSPYPWYDGYYVFTVMCDVHTPPEQALQLYELVRPVLWPNTNLGGT